MTRARDIADRNVDSTTIDGVDSTQLLRSDIADTKTAGDLSFSDNVKAVFGAGSDLQIYHSGSASFIDDVGTGNLNLRADAAIAFQNSTGTEEFARFISNGAVQLNYDDSIKITTTATGADINGVLTADGLTVDTTGIVYSGGNVGIGTASVDNKLHLENAGTLYLQIENTSTANKFYLGNSGGNAILESTGAYSMNFKTNGSEAARFDSSQNFLVGKTSASVANDGIQLEASGTLGVTRANDDVAIFNRKSSDGNIAVFRKDNTTVGSIGSYGGVYANIGTGNVGLMFNTSASAVIPHNMTTNAPRGSGIDLGQTGYKWKDAHFSGTVNATSYTGDGSSLTGIAAGATGGGSDEIFWENGQTVTTNYTITNGKNAMSAGPITINTGVTVTVGTGETWTVV